MTQVSQQIKKRVLESTVFVLVPIAAYFLLSLITYHPNDPGSFASSEVSVISNLGGVSGAYLADDPTEAAEKAAAERNWKSTDFIDRCVAVSTIIGDEPKLFDVTVESRPEYTARQRA